MVHDEHTETRGLAAKQTALAPLTGILPALKRKTITFSTVTLSYHVAI